MYPLKTSPNCPARGKLRPDQGTRCSCLTEHLVHFGGNLSVAPAGTAELFGRGVFALGLGPCLLSQRILAPSVLHDCMVFVVRPACLCRILKVICKNQKPLGSSSAGPSHKTKGPAKTLQHPGAKECSSPGLRKKHNEPRDHPKS